MNTVTIPKKEYRDLVDAKLCYEYLRQVLNADIFFSPSTKNKSVVVKAFKATGKYNQKFLKNLKAGLGRSAYFK